MKTIGISALMLLLFFCLCLNVYPYETFGKEFNLKTWHIGLNSNNSEGFSLTKDYKAEAFYLKVLFLSQEKQEKKQKLVMEEYVNRLAKIESMRKEIAKEKSKKEGFLIGGIGTAGLSGVLLYLSLTGEYTENEYGETVMTGGQKFGLWTGLASAGLSAIFFNISINTNKKLYAKKTELKKYEQEFAMVPLPEDKLFDLEAKVPERPKLTKEEEKKLELKKQEMDRQRRIESLRKQIKDIQNYQTGFYIGAAATGIAGVIGLYKGTATLLDVEKEFSESAFVIGLLGCVSSYVLFRSGMSLNKKIIKHRQDLRAIEKEKYKKIYSLNLIPLRGGLCFSLDYSF